MEESLTFGDMELSAMHKSYVRKHWISIDYISYLIQREARFHK